MLIMEPHMRPELTDLRTALTAMGPEPTEMHPEPVDGRELLAHHTTLRVGGPARRMIIAETETELVDAVRDLDAAEEPIFVLGGGSNVLIGDAGFDGTVVKVATRGIADDEHRCSGAVIPVAAGEDWDRCVQRRHRTGLERAGSHVRHPGPGRRDADPERRRVRGRSRDYLRPCTLGPVHGAHKTLFPVALAGSATGPHGSRPSPDAFWSLSVTFQFRTWLDVAADPLSPSWPEPWSRARRAAAGRRRTRGGPGAAPRQGHGARAGRPRHLERRVLLHQPSCSVRPRLSTCLRLRHASANPTAMVKTSAAWLIEHAGFAKGYGDGAARLSSKHTLALTNRGGATAADLLTLAREIRAGVQARYGIELDPEPVLVGCEL